MIDLFANPFALALQGGVHLFDTIDGTGDGDSLTGTSGDDLIHGLGGGDTIDGLGGNDSIDGGEGNDLIYGGPGSDTIDGGAGNDIILGVDSLPDSGSGDSLAGGDGNDIIVGSLGPDFVDGGAGSDSLSSYGNGDTVHGGDDSDHLATDSSFGAASSDVILYGDGGDDLLNIFTSGAKHADGCSMFGGDGADTLILWSRSPTHNGYLVSGDAGDDLMKVRGAGGDDTLDGGSGFDTASYVGRHFDVTFDLVAGTVGGKGMGHDTLIGVEGFVGGIADDVATGDSLANGLSGKNGFDMLIGGGGNDTIMGGGRDDTITGGLGADSMDGGGGHDVFVYNSVTESTGAARDVIDHFKKHDVIDLSAIDADVNTAGDQAFTRVAAFDGHAGQMTLSFSGGVTLLQVDVDGDAQADMTIQLTGHVTGHSDFVM